MHQSWWQDRDAKGRFIAGTPNAARRRSVSAAPRRLALPAPRRSATAARRPSASAAPRRSAPAGRRAATAKPSSPPSTARVTRTRARQADVPDGDEDVKPYSGSVPPGFEAYAADEARRSAARAAEKAATMEKEKGKAIMEEGMRKRNREDVGCSRKKVKKANVEEDKENGEEYTKYAWKRKGDKVIYKFEIGRMKIRAECHDSSDEEDARSHALPHLVIEEMAEELRIALKQRVAKAPRA